MSEVEEMSYTFVMKKVLTLGYLLKDTVICLALKKRGFGEDYWNGFGSKKME